MRRACVCVLLLLALSSWCLADTFPVISALDSGLGTLRDAISLSNAQTAQSNNIVFSGVSFIALNTEIEITHSVTITGPVIIDGNEDTRIFRFSKPGTFVISDLTLQNGYYIASTVSDGGGCVQVADASIDISFNRVVFSNCYIDSGGSGGAISLNAASALISDCDFMDNFAESKGGAIYVEQVTSGLQIASNSLFVNNRADFGGAIYTESGTSITDSNLSENVATFQGGGVYAESITILRCGFDSNYVNGGPTSIADHLYITQGVTNIVRDTSFLRGEGYTQVAVRSGARADFYFVTLTAAPIATQITTIDTASIYVDSTSTLELGSSIVYNYDLTTNDVDLFVEGNFISAGYNILGKINVPSGAVLGTDDLLDTDPVIDCNALYCTFDGSSPAYNSADDAFTLSEQDQLSKYAFLRKDRGAFEYRDHTLASSAGKGDPKFTGFYGQKFGFDGIAGQVFHLFSDAFINLNAYFAYANPQQQTGTVMTKFALQWFAHNLTFTSDGILFIDSVAANLQSVIKVDSCVEIMMLEKGILVSTPVHDIIFSVVNSHNAHINTSYLNIDFNIKTEQDYPLCGGVIGQTAQPHFHPSTIPALFATKSGLFGTDALSNKYLGKALCDVTVVSQTLLSAKSLHA